MDRDGQKPRTQPPPAAEEEQIGERAHGAEMSPLADDAEAALIQPEHVDRLAAVRDDGGLSIEFYDADGDAGVRLSLPEINEPVELSVWMQGSWSRP